MQLFQSSVLKQHLSQVDEEASTKALKVYKKVYLSNIENIKSSKEEQYQYGFLNDLFVKVLGYTLGLSDDEMALVERE